MKQHTLILLAALLLFNYTKAQTMYEPQDSLFIEKILRNITNSCYKEFGTTIGVAKEFLGTPYVSGTLDRSNKEINVVNTREVDCTTFMEQVAAIVITSRDGKNDFKSFCESLKYIRYREGKCNGYADRLHYISQWITDAEKKGIAEEILTSSHIATQRLNLNFMSRHPQSYKQINTDTLLLNEIENHEKPFRDIDIRYIPKERLNKPKNELGIENGDIIALVTNIDGLDVSHVGFAIWKDNLLHLIHASSSKEEVIADTQTLYSYMKDKKNHLGIRVFRIKE